MIYGYTIQSMMGNPQIKAEVIARLIATQAPHPVDPTLPVDEQEDFVSLLESAQAEELFGRLIEREIEQDRIKSLDDISDPESTLYRLMKAAHVATAISAADYVEFRNYALEPAKRIFGEYLRTKPGLKGSNLGRLIEVFGYSPTGDDERDADSSDRSDQRIRSFFESDAKMKEIIFRWFKGSKEDKKRTIEALHLS